MKQGSDPHNRAIVWVRGETFKAESETADLGQPKWNETQTVLATAIHNPDRDTGPLEGTAAGNWSLRIVEQSQGRAAGEGERQIEGMWGRRLWWEMPVEESRAAMEARQYCWVMWREWSHHHSLSLPTCHHWQLNNRQAGPSNTWHTELQGWTTLRMPR